MVEKEEISKDSKGFDENCKYCAFSEGYKECCKNCDYKDNCISKH